MEQTDELLKNLWEAMRSPGRCRRQDLQAFLQDLVDRINGKAEDGAHVLRAHLDGDGSVRIYIGHDSRDWDDLPFFEIRASDKQFDIVHLYAEGIQRTPAPAVPGKLPFVWSPLERAFYSGERPIPRTADEREERELLTALLFELGEAIVRRLES